MSLLVRKVDKGKWLQADIIADDDVSADAVTLDLRTNDNKLSVWEIESLADINNAVLAMAAANQHLETIDVVALDPGSILSGAIDIECLATEQWTPVDDLNDSHKNLRCLSYSRLGTIARLIVEEFRRNEVRRYSEGQLKTILKDAIASGRLQPDRLSDFIRRKLRT